MINSCKDIIVNKSTYPIEETTAKTKNEPYADKDFEGGDGFVFHFTEA